MYVPGLDQRTSESETAAGTASRDARPAFSGALQRALAGSAAVAGGAPRRPSMVVAWVAPGPLRGVHFSGRLLAQVAGDARDGGGWMSYAGIVEWRLRLGRMGAAADLFSPGPLTMG
jgi:hypothetical protein